MLTNFRNFPATDPFGRVWDVEFRWYQNAISIRHADCVDVKYFLRHEGEEIERVVALPHPVLVSLAKQMDRPLTDAWTLKLASLYLLGAVETWADMDQTILTPSRADLEPLAETLARDAAERAAEVR